MLTNQPMGFYAPATLVKDAQRHGQHFHPVDIQCSAYECVIETVGETRYVRLGFNYVKGLRAQAARAIVDARGKQPFTSLRDLVRRVPQLNKKELATLAELGALNALPEHQADRNRRGALWQTAAAARPVGALLEAAVEDSELSQLEVMTPRERVYADFEKSGLTIGQHPMSFCRSQLCEAGIVTSEQAKRQRNGAAIQVAGCVITRQRPGTAKGFVFLSLEDETGIVNVIVHPDLFERSKTACVSAPYLKIRGSIQVTWNVISLKAATIEPLALGQQTIRSHDFH